MMSGLAGSILHRQPVEDCSLENLLPRFAAIVVCKDHGRANRPRRVRGEVVAVPGSTTTRAQCVPIFQACGFPRFTAIGYFRFRRQWKRCCASTIHRFRPRHFSNFRIESG
jgi:hypothetical protein